MKRGTQSGRPGKSATNSNQVACAFAIHWDHHPTGPEQHYGAGTSATQIRSYLRRIRPDYTQFHALGQAGYAAFPSRIAPAVPGLVGDPVKTWCDACRAERTPFGLYVAAFACGFPRPAPRWQAQDRSGKTVPGWFCWNGPYLDEFLMPLLAELIERYQPGHFWLDGTWLPHLRELFCFCEHCRRRFQSDTGRRFPATSTEKDWRDYQNMMERSIDDAIRRVGDFLHGRTPPVFLAANTMYFFRDLRKPQTVDWLSWDAVNGPDLDRTAFEAAYTATAGLPAEVVIFEHGIAPSKSFVIRLRPKAQLLCEASLLLAHGVRVHLWHNPEEDGRIAPDAAPRAAALARFVRRRQRVSVGPDRASPVALLASRRQYDLDPARLDRALRAAHRLLREAHVPCDILREDTWRERRRLYRLCVLPEISALDPTVAKELRTHVEEGGRVLVVPAPLAQDAQPWNQSLLGAEIAPVPGRTGTLRIGGETVPLEAPRYQLPEQCRTLLRLSGGEAWLTECRIGKGRLFALGSEVFTEYATHWWPKWRDVVGQVVRRCAGPGFPLRMKGWPNIDVVVRQDRRATYVHLVNVATANSHPGPSVLFFDVTPVSRDVRLSLRCAKRPSAVRVVPRGIKCSTSWRAGWLSLRVDTIEHHAVICIAP